MVGVKGGGGGGGGRGFVCAALPQVNDMKASVEISVFVLPM